MITNRKNINFSEEYLISQHINPADCIFFDIETTGFRAGTSHLYLIGAAVRTSSMPKLHTNTSADATAVIGESWTILQWMAEQPQEETQLLRTFTQFMKSYHTVLHFNGDRFDIPYMNEKYTQYQLPSPFADRQSVDLYHLFRPLKPLLKLDHMKQKSLEVFLGQNRDDQYDGGKLIPVYRSFCKDGSPHSCSLLLLHNQEDVSGMFSLTSIFSYLNLFQGNYSFQSAQILSSQDGHRELLITLDLPLPVPVPVSHMLDFGYFTLRDQCGKLLIPILEDNLYYFFPDYKNYYYLPAEDQAIHKSIASYVDRQHRTAARAETCYIRKNGPFLPQPGEQNTPAFRRSYKDDLRWFSLTDEFLHSREQLEAYARLLISHIACQDI
ncbi:MAG: ribonuclease H-like domain-containing protein [Lachnospiraceae bacterium]|nr:ribonuclease H-like domain-containing protein [Lachnospiraceae bacterium]